MKMVRIINEYFMVDSILKYRKYIYDRMPEKIKFIVLSSYFKLLKSNEFKINYNKLENISTITFNDGISVKISGLLNHQPHIINGYLSQYKLKLNDVVFDIGAYIGLFSLYASKKIGPGGKIFAFEPNSESFKILCLNLQLNNITNVIPLNIALDSEDGFSYLNIQGNESSIKKDDKNSGAEIKVIIEINTIDTIIKKFCINKLNFVKMDIEGAEIEVLRTANTLFILKPSFAIASYHIVNGSKTYSAVEKEFEKRGYFYVTGYSKHLTTYGWPSDN